MIQIYQDCSKCKEVTFHKIEEVKVIVCQKCKKKSKIE